MDNDNIITWTPTNWITVVLMASIAFFAIGVVQKYIATKNAAN